jgi:hypothetical protein
MITKFDSLYAGHTDLDNIGYGGTPINERRYSNAHLATALSKAESMATLMDGLGYNCFWMAEHHFQREGTECIPNTILMALHLAPNEKHQDWLRLQYHSDVAPAAAGGGLRYR